jgi:hypothetical protein
MGIDRVEGNMKLAVFHDNRIRLFSTIATTDSALEGSTMARPVNLLNAGKMQ